MRSTIAIALALGACACASAPPAPVTPPPPTFEEKVSWILRLEDQRVLRDRAAAVPAAAPAPAGRGRLAVVPAPPPPPPDLVRLLSDPEGRVRRRAALGIGRTGLVEGVTPLVTLLGTDVEPEVRQMAAFALGLIGDRTARDPLVAALNDPSVLVKGAAAEGLGLIGDATAAAAIGQMMSQVSAGLPVQSAGEDNDADRNTPSAAFHLGAYALVRLRAFDALAAVVMDAGGQPRIRTWPVAFALQRLEDRRALPALLTLLKEPHPYTRAFAAKGLGAMNDRSAGAALVPLVPSPDKTLATEAIRSLARLAERSAAPPLLAIVRAANADPHVRLEAVTALGRVGGEGVADALIDLLGDPRPVIRGAALRSLAQIDPDGFITILSGLDLDTEWTVRVTLAEVLGTLTPEAGGPRLLTMVADAEPRVVPAVIAALAKLKLPEAAAIATERLAHEDAVVRAAAARAIEELTPAGAPPALKAAYERGRTDTMYNARAAALSALTAYGAAEATPVLTTALGDPDWAVRVRAAALLKQLDSATDADVRIRPAPALPVERYESSRIVAPPVSTEAHIETDRGTIRIELAVLDAPQTVENFVTLARRRFFEGIVVHRVVPDFVVQAGDPRGDGEGGPGYVIRDELTQRPYLRGTVGMALDWEDTGGSQFFIALSPQPHLDARYTVFGRVLSGMEIADQIEVGDVIRRVRIWDGTSMTP